MNALRRDRKKLWTALIVLTLAFIWGNSLLPPERSFALSDMVQKALSYFTPVDSPAGAAGGTWSAVVRKLAHFTEFCVLGALLRLRLRSAEERPWPPLLAGLLAALTDETIQYFTARTSLVFDVWLDFAGAAAGVLLIWAIERGKRTDNEEKTGR